MTLRGQPLAVSVIVPVFNPGPFLRPLLDALDDQAPVDGGFDAIFVDDGSSDGTEQALERWCARRPWARVIHQPNSGWPSSPRNVGIAASDAEFVQFVDQDDRLTPHALSTLVDFARAADSDVVIGRMRGEGRKVPVALFARTVRDARAPEVPLPSSMSAHAMFRRQFLNANGLRFDETARRLEDHLFLSVAYTRARHVSVFADAPVYVHVARSDGAGAGFTAYDPGAYYRDLSRAIAIVTEALPAGAERDAYLNRWMRIELVGRLRSEAVRWMPQPRRDAFFTAVRATIQNAMPSDMIQRIPAAWRWPTALALVAMPDEFLHAEDRMTLSRVAVLKDVPGSIALADDVSPDTLRRAVALVGTDEPLPTGRAASSPHAALLRRLRQAAVAHASSGTGRTHAQLVSWGRTPMRFWRQAGAAAVPVIAALAFLCSLVAAAPATIALVIVAAVITTALAVRSTGGTGTAVRQLLLLAACVPGAATAGASVPAAGAVLATGAVLAGAGYVADGILRRRCPRAHAGARAWRRPGAIAVTATVVTAACVTAAVFATLAH